MQHDEITVGLLVVVLTGSDAEFGLQIPGGIMPSGGRSHKMPSAAALVPEGVLTREGLGSQFERSIK